MNPKIKGETWKTCLSEFAEVFIEFKFSQGFKAVKCREELKLFV